MSRTQARSRARVLVATIGVAAAVAACSAPSSGSAPSPTPPSAAAPAPPQPARMLRLDDSGVYANLYLPAASGGAERPAHTLPALVLIGGSEGGVAAPLVAQSVAEQGFAVLAVAYFGEKDEPRLPATLTGIPIDYFATAARALAGQPEVDPAHVVVWGGSRGSEAAALLAGNYPTLVHGAVLESPSSVVNAGLPRSANPAWTLHGAPVAAVPDHDTDDPDPADAQDALLPIAAITGPIVTVCGGLDGVWHSCDYSAAIARLAGASPGRVTALSYPDAGHSPVSFGIYAAAGIPLPARDGGSAAADVAAAHDALPRIIAALRTGTGR